MADAARQTSNDGSGAIVKPIVDTFKYRFLTLDNGLRAVLVSDTEADKAAASLEVGVGSYSDPDDIPGLAHFLEHMLFFASEKYPEENGYGKFIQTHGGSVNAFTAGMRTNFYFDVNAQHLEPALDRFSQFFVAPLISKSGVEREANAVDSEFRNTISNDGWRQIQLWRSTANPKHPWSRFLVGNVATLITNPEAAGKDPHERVWELYRKEYGAGIMRLAVVGNNTLDELEAMVKPRFSGVAEGRTSRPTFDEAMLTAAQEARLIRVVPVKEKNVLELHWQVPAQAKLYPNKPIATVTHLLGHEGKGSIHAWLRQQGWGENLNAGELRVGDLNNTLLTLKIELTDAGQKNVRDILAGVFYYLSMLRASNDTALETVNNEVIELEELGFNFRNKPQPDDYAISLSGAMQLYEDADLIKAIYGVPGEIEISSVRELLDLLTPDKVRIMWASPSFAADSKSTASESDAPANGSNSFPTDSDLAPPKFATEPFYGTQYENLPIPDSWMKAFGDPIQIAELHLPEPNPFISTDFDLVEGDKDKVAPSKVVEEDGLIIWHNAHVALHVPKTVVYFSISLPNAVGNPFRVGASRVALKYLSDRLNELLYPADLAGLDFQMISTAVGFRLRVQGFSQKLPTLLTSVLDTLAEVALGELDKDKFETAKEATIRAYRNVQFAQPVSLALDVATFLRTSTPGQPYTLDQLPFVQALSFPQFATYLKTQLLSQALVKALVAGNMAREPSVKMVKDAVAKLRDSFGLKPPSPAAVPQTRLLQLPTGWGHQYKMDAPNPTDVNSATVVLFQFPEFDTLSASVACQVLAHVFSKDFFAELRTKQQLGYIVQATSLVERGVPHLILLVQSATFGTDVMDRRIEGFVVNYLSKLLRDMSEEDFSIRTEELAVSKLEALTTITQVATRMYNELVLRDPVFDRNVVEAKAIRAFTRADAIKALETYLLDTKTRVRLAVHIVGKTERDATANGAAQTSGGSNGAEEPATSPAEGPAESPAPAAAEPSAEAPAPTNGGATKGGEELTLGEEDGIEAETKAVDIPDMYGFKRAAGVFPSTT